MINRDIPFVDLPLTERDVEAVAEVIRSKKLLESDQARRFEKDFSRFTGAKYSLTCANGTAALHLALEAIGINPGDEVLTPAFTFIATSNSILFVGGIPKFVDINPKTWNMDPEMAEKAITEKTKALMPVHIFGLGADMKAFRDLAEDKDLLLIEDAAQAHGTKIDGHHAGTWGDIATFSLYATKNLISGEGGVVTTNNEELAEKVESLKNHGRTKQGGYKHVRVGFNYRMTDMQAAIANVQLEKLPKMLEQRKTNAEHYRRVIDELPNLDYQRVPKGFTHGNYIFGLDTRNSMLKPSEFVTELKKQRVLSRPIYSTLSYEQENFKHINNWRWAKFVKYPDYSNLYLDYSEKISKNHLEIPVVPSLTEEERTHVGNVLKEILDS